MYKLPTKKMLTVLIAVAMVFSALAILSFAAQPANATLSPTITFSPSELTTAQIPLATQISSTGIYNPTIAITSQLSDPASSIVYFLWSTSPSLSGIPGTETPYYEASPPSAGLTYIAADTVLTPVAGTFGPTFTAGQTAYLIATTESAAPFTSTLGFGEFTVSSYTPLLELNGGSSASAAAGSELAISGSGYSSSTTSVTIYFNYAGSSVVLGSVGVSGGAIVSNAQLLVPENLPELALSGSSAYYAIIAVDTPGETAVAALQITPAITVSPVDTTGVTGTVLTINGFGFMAGQTISTSTSSIQIQTSLVGTSHSAVTVSASGSFTVQATLLSSLASSPGPQGVIITLGNPSEISTFTDVFYVSTPNPVALGFVFEDTVLASTTAGYPTDSIAATVYDFPAGAAVNIYLGSTKIGAVTTDANGYGTLPASAVLPGLPAGAYIAVASTSTGFFKSQSFTVDSFFSVSDPAGTPVATAHPTINEYVPNTGNLTVSAYGLAPGTSYTVTDAMSSHSNYQVGNVEPNVVSVKVGTAVGKPHYNFLPASNGTLIFTYTAAYLQSYSGTPLTTGWASSITMSPSITGPNYGSGIETFGYLAIGTPDISTPGSLAVYYPGEAAQTLTVSNLIPSTATYLYPGVNNEYNSYLGTSELSFVSSATSVSGTITFTVAGSTLTGITDQVLFTVNGQPYYVEATSGTLTVTGTSYSTTLSGTLYEGAPTGTSIGTFVETVSLTGITFPGTTTISAGVSVSGTFSGTNGNSQAIDGSVSASVTASGQASGSALPFSTASVGITSGAANVFSASSGTATLSFNVGTSQATGLQNITVMYNGSGVSKALTAVEVVVSSPSSSPSAGSLVAVPIISSGSLTGYDVVGYNFDPSLTSPTIYYMGYSGLLATGSSFTIDSTTGSFVFSTATHNSIYTLPTELAGNYSMFVVGTVGTTTYTIYGSYNVPVVFSPYSLSVDPVTGLAEYNINSYFSVDASGLQPLSYYDVYFNGTYEATVVTSSTGGLSHISGGGYEVFTIPTVNVGTYNVTLNPTGSMTPVATAQVEVLSSTTLSLISDQGYAFPGQIVDFVWTPTTTTGLVNPSTPGAGPVYVTVYLNGTAFTTFPAAYTTPSAVVTLGGSFQMPNAPAGTYWYVTLGWSQSTSTSQTVDVSTAFASPSPTPESSTAPTGFGTSSATTSTGQVVFAIGATTGEIASYTITAQIAFGANVFEFGGASETLAGSFTPTVTKLAGSGIVNNALIVVTAFTPSGSAGGTASVSFYVTGSFNGLPFTSNTITESQIPSATATSPTTYTDYLALPGSYSAPGSVSVMTMASYAQSFTGTTGAYMQLVSGNGALLTGISSGQIATLVAEVKGAVTTSMQVPLSELNASVVAINGAVAKINTAFGNMTATLKSINATVASIESGQVLVMTKLGSIETSLASLNASLAAFNGNVVKISTTLGNVTTSLSSIGTQVTTNGNGIATIKTDLGTVQGQIVSTNGNISTIKTSLGTLQTNVTKITPSLTTLEIFLIVAIVLILITLVIAFMAVSNTNKLAKKLEEQKKQ